MSVHSFELEGYARLADISISPAALNVSPEECKIARKILNVALLTLIKQIPLVRPMDSLIIFAGWLMVYLMLSSCWMHSTRIMVPFNFISTSDHISKIHSISNVLLDERSLIGFVVWLTEPLACPTSSLLFHLSRFFLTRRPAKPNPLPKTGVLLNLCY